MNYALDQAILSPLVGDIRRQIGKLMLMLFNLEDRLKISLIHTQGLKLLCINDPYAIEYTYIYTCSLCGEKYYCSQRTPAMRIVASSINKIFQRREITTYYFHPTCRDVLMSQLLFIKTYITT